MSEKLNYGPGITHPLSQVKTEFILEGKYDVDGNRREVDVGAFPTREHKSRFAHNL